MKSCWEKRESVNSGVHAKLIDLFKLYLVVGGKPTTEKAAYRLGEKVHVRVPVKNTGKVAGREVVQLYVRDANFVKFGLKRLINLDTIHIIHHNKESHAHEQ